MRVLFAILFFLGLSAAAYSQSIPFVTTPDATAERMGPGIGPMGDDLVVIIDNTGGRVSDFQIFREQLIASKAEVRIGGFCASSCTLFLSVPNVCVDKGARLIFHAPFVQYRQVSDEGSVRGYNYRYIEQFTSQYPENIRKWLKSKGGLQVGILILKGKELAKLVRICDQPVTFQQGDQPA